LDEVTFDPALIAIDWGTTSARAYGIDAVGRVMASRSAELGVQRVAEGRFPQALDALLGDWRKFPVPRIACGMIGSRQGWIEVPYVPCPADLDAFGNALVRTPGGELLVVPGALCRDADGVPDVMRGEETQLVGAMVADDERVLAVLPGTHSKWAVVDEGRLLGFATFMTGELYAVLLDHSILGRMANRRYLASGGALADAVEASAPPVETSRGDAAFRAGLHRGWGMHALAHDIFGARTLALANELDAVCVPEWLSGVLIGHEIAGARRWVEAWGVSANRVRVIGAEALAGRYERALACAGVVTDRAANDAAATGLWRIAQRAGVVHTCEPARGPS
jgi:2-dehydro-3-deoxygalactonokinase